MVSGRSNHCASLKESSLGMAEQREGKDLGSWSQNH